MDERDIALRRVTYRLFVDLGRAPSLQEVSGVLHVGGVRIERGWRRLHEAHALVLETDDPRRIPRIRMANPFSAVPTAFRVQAAGRDWFANCAWDAFGICAALHVDGHIDTSCPDCQASIGIDVQNQQPVQTDSWFHCLVPAARWWDDIVFT